MNDDRFPDFNKPAVEQRITLLDSSNQVDTPDKAPGNPYEAQSLLLGSDETARYNDIFKSILRLLFSFQGRASIAQYWLVKLCIVLLAFTLIMIGIGISYLFREVFELLLPSQVIMFYFIFAFICIAWINLAVTVRRFHDRDKSGAMVFVGLIPYIGGFWILIECGFMTGSNGPNQYGQPVLSILD